MAKIILSGHPSQTREIKGALRSNFVDLIFNADKEFLRRDDGCDIRKKIISFASTILYTKYQTILAGEDVAYGRFDCLLCNKRVL